MPRKRKVRVLIAPTRAAAFGATGFRRKPDEPTPEHDTAPDTIPDDLLVEIVKMSPQEIYHKIAAVEVEYNDEYGSRATFQVPVVNTVMASTTLHWRADVQYYCAAEYPDDRTWTARLETYMKEAILHALTEEISSAGGTGGISSTSALAFEEAAADFLPEQSEFGQHAACEVDLRSIHRTVHHADVAAVQPARLSNADVARLFGA